METFKRSKSRVQGCCEHSLGGGHAQNPGWGHIPIAEDVTRGRSERSPYLRCRAKGRNLRWRGALISGAPEGRPRISGEELGGGKLLREFASALSPTNLYAQL